MDWLKKNYGKTMLLVIALGIIMLAFLLFQQASAFDDTFNAMRGTRPQGTQLQPLPLEVLVEAQEALQKPFAWEVYPESLFVSAPYIDREGVLVSPFDDDQGPLHEPVPNTWFGQYTELDILDPDVLQQDPDEDGFTNLEEWRHDTNPVDPESHPPFYILLSVKEAQRVRNRVVFQSHMGGETFVVNTIDISGPTQFLSVGDPIAGTKFKIAEFDKKETERVLSGGETLAVDVSELVIEGVETGERMNLVVEQTYDLGESFVTLGFRLNKSEVRVRRGDEFTLSGGDDTKYRLVELQDDGALVEIVDRNESFRVTVDGVAPSR
ncbi:MAG: Amuc_1099 family pilus-like system protein [Verrucomicrobiales bacterium]